ncbi:hypothetical protein PCYB_102050 [Plasmodium cynomolgi strain B]|uniref:Uncharacterized protein n=1 Tax=Plasmodium cynomolgi (strain B) TaxID=1120755 RepID=K6UWR2_PLACD|nr:hypothetical protein PCYB_102050 [Plasmodium cynomolgi strain B]GAB66855.1 hypothetical protein PCYB_102050 [Plasmodium cynomolgi strain B]
MGIKRTNISELICSAIFEGEENGKKCTLGGGSTLMDVNAKCASVNRQGISNHFIVPIEGAPSEAENVNKINDPLLSSTKNDGVHPHLQLRSVSSKDANSEVHICAEKKNVVERLDFSTEHTTCGRNRGNLARHGSLSFFFRFRKMMVMDSKKGKKGTKRRWRHKKGENKISTGETNQVNARHEKKLYKESASGVRSSRRRSREQSGRAEREGGSFNKYDLVRRDMNTSKNSVEKRKKKKLIDHAKEHFCETMHNYFFDISKNSVFDYSSNLYIKKLINLKSGKKNLKKIYSANININGKEEIIEKNIIMYIYEFNQLLSALLESQRDHFMSCIYDLKLNYENAKKDNSREASKCLNELKMAEERNKQLKSQVKKKISILHEKAKTNAELLQQLRNVEIINAKLCEDQKQEIHNQEAMAEEKKKIIREKQQIIRELKQQITDLSFHKQVVAKFSQNSGMTNSSFIIGEKMTPKSRFKKR